MNDGNLKILSKGRSGRLLLEVCEEIKRKVADIRTPLKIRAEIQNEVRLGIIEAIDSFIVERVKVFSGAIDPQDPNEFE